MNWKDVVGYEGIYQISDTGEVYSVRNDIVLRKQLNNKEYYYVALSLDGERKVKKIHRLVCEAFIENPNGYDQVNHISEVKTDNRVENLEWCTVKMNNNHGTRVERVSTSNRTRKKKQIGRFSLDGELLQIYNGYREVEEDGYNAGNVSSCCSNKAYHKTHAGFIWKHIKN